MKSYKAKSVILDNLELFGSFFDPFWAPGDALRVLSQKFSTVRKKYNLVQNFRKKVMDGYPAIVRTHARTPLKTIVPLR